jgi:TatD DNase family protein
MLIDVHAHIDYYEKGDLPAVLGQINDTPILTLSAAVNPDAYARNLELEKRSDWLVATFGVHPLHAPKYADRLDELQDRMDQSPLLAEVGLDHFRAKDPADYPAQVRVLEFLLAHARDHDKLVTVHTKAAEAEALALLDRYAIRRAIIHWYQGPMDVLRELVARGYYFSIGFEVLTVEHVRDIARAVPMEQLLSETDNPAARSRMSAQPMPLLVAQVVKGMAGIRGVSPVDMEQTIQANWTRLIDGDPRLEGIGRRIIGQ